VSDAIRLGDRLSLHYRLNCNGEEIVNTFDDAPETFTLGHGEIDARLETLLLGLNAGEHRTFELAPGEAFGARDENLLHTLPRAEFPASDSLKLGDQIAFTLPGEQSLSGIVRALDNDTVRIDFNHPLAGLPVCFEVKILAVERG